MYEIAPLPCKTEFPKWVFCLFIHAFLPILGHLHMQPMDQCFLMNVYLGGKTAPRLVQWSGTSNELDAYQPCCHRPWKVILGFHVLQCPSNDAVGKEKVKDFFQLYLGGGFKYFFIFTPILGKMNPFWLLLFKGVGSTTNYRYKLYTSFSIILLALRAAIYKL